MLPLITVILIFAAETETEILGESPLGIHWQKQIINNDQSNGWTHTHTNIHRGPVNKTNTNHTLLGEAQVDGNGIDLWVH